MIGGAWGRGEDEAVKFRLYLPLHVHLFLPFWPPPVAEPLVLSFMEALRHGWKKKVLEKKHLLNLA